MSKPLKICMPCSQPDVVLLGVFMVGFVTHWGLSWDSFINLFKKGGG
jgi:hypothetical protein